MARRNKGRVFTGLPPLPATGMAAGYEATEIIVIKLTNQQDIFEMPAAMMVKSFTLENTGCNAQIKYGFCPDKSTWGSPALLPGASKAFGNDGKQVYSQRLYYCFEKCNDNPIDPETCEQIPLDESTVEFCASLELTIIKC